MTSVNVTPNLTSLERDSLVSAPSGSLIFNIDTNELEVLSPSSGWLRILDPLNASPEQNVYVSVDGDNATGTGTISAPYQTIEYALSQITDASQTKPYTIKITTGQYVENNLLLKPYINLDGGNSQLQVTGAISLDASYSAGGNCRISDFGELNAQILLNFDALNAQESIIYIDNCSTFSNNLIDITGTANILTLLVASNVYGFDLTLNDMSGLLQDFNIGVLNINKINAFPIRSVILNSCIINTELTANQSSSGAETLRIETLACRIRGATTLVSTNPLAFLTWLSQADDSYTIELNGAGVVYDTDKFSKIPTLLNGAQYTLRNLSNGINANYTPNFYSPSDDSVNGHLVGIDNAIGSASSESLQTAYDNGNTIQMSSGVNVTINDSLGNSVLETVESGANSYTAINRKAVVTDDSTAGPFFEFINSSVGLAGTELGTVTVSGLASDTSVRSFNAINHEVINPSPGNYSVSQFFNSYENGVETKYMEFDGIGQIEFYKNVDMKGNGILAAGNISAIGSTVTAQDLTALDTVSGQNVLTDTININTATANTLLGTDAFKNVVSSNLTGDVTTLNSLTTTLATVNANVGTFGDATNIPQFTVNGKGLITAVSTLPVDFSSIDLQLVYDNSAPGHEILLDTNLKLSSTTNPLNNFEWSTAVGQALFLMRTDQNASIIRMEDNNPTVGTLTRICSLGSSIQYADYSVEALSVTPAAETSRCTLTGLSSGTPIDYLKYDGSTSTVNLPVDTTITTTTPSTSTTTGSLVNSGGFGNAGDAWVGGNINTSGNMSSLSVTTASINGLTPQGGLSSGTSNSAILTASTAEQSILSTTFVGSRVAPANSFGVGDSFVAVLAGNFSASNGDTLTLRLKGGPTGTTVLSSIVIPLNNATGTYFELEIDFVIRAIGAAGVADIVANYDFSYNQASGGNFQGERKCENNNTTFDTTVNNTLDITAQFSSASASNSIETLLSTLGKTY